MANPAGRPVIVVINDDPVELSRTCAVLEKEGLAAVPYGNVGDALQGMRVTGPPDTIVTDMYLGDMDGWGLCKLLRSSEYAAFHRVPVVVLSAAETKDDVDRNLTGKGQSAFVSMACDATALGDHVRSLLDKRPGETPSRPPAADADRKRGQTVEGAGGRDEAQSRCCALLEAIPEIVFVCDEQGRLLYINPAGAHRLERTAQEVVGQRVERYLAPDAVEEMRRGIAEACLDGPSVFETRFVLELGVPIECEVHARRIAFGEAPAVLCVTRDLTKRRRGERFRADLEMQVRQAQKMQAIGTLAGGIAHDLNNILSPILGYADIAYSALAEDDVVRNYLGEILKAGNRAKDLVQQILTFSHQVDQELKPVEIHLIVKEALNLMKAALPSTIEIRRNVPSVCGTVLADPTQIHQVIMNLCTNAYHAMRNTGGVLNVSLEVVELDAENAAALGDIGEGTYIQLTVSDTGHGMDRATQERIFEPFFSTKPPDEGSGMGLATVHGIVTHAKGAVAVHSELGQGATFEVYLPRYSAIAEPEVIATGPLPRGGETLLVVDDEEAIVAMIRETLELLGYTVVGCTSSREALATFESAPNRFDLVITDQTMPKITGEELARRFLRIRPGLPIMLVTGFSEIFTYEDAKRIGVRDYLMKPIFPRDLAKSVRRILDTPPS